MTNTRKFELQLQGFNGASDATDQLILWVEVDLDETCFKAWLQTLELYRPDGAGAIARISELPDDFGVDFLLPMHIERLRNQIQLLIGAVA